jgi:hypothetical protein
MKAAASSSPTPTKATSRRFGHASRAGAPSVIIATSAVGTATAIAQPVQAGAPAPVRPASAAA